MADARRFTGKCLCGAVTFSFDTDKRDFGACHCSMCRRWSGGAWLAFDVDGQIDISGEENVTFFQSSEWGERGFCKKCGTNLFWRLQDKSLYVVSVGALDDAEGLRFAQEIFVDEKPSHYGFANETKKMTGAEFMASVMGEGDQG